MYKGYAKGNFLKKVSLGTLQKLSKIWFGKRFLSITPLS